MVPELFDAVELLVTLPESNLHIGVRGAIVDCYDDGNYELSSEQFLVVWLTQERRWLSGR
ncbi:MAG: DUF4926 domain-containing protein [Oscillatoriales cyanobacterium]|nr:MAG: DUF4926 domain-containing protein [Oscillatoriales cyanobacterium]